MLIMKYIAFALKYIKNNFFRLLLLTAVPAALFAMFASPSRLILFATGYDPQGITSLGGVIGALLPMSKAIWLLLLIPAAAVFASMTFGFMEHHMRMGVFGARGILRRLNYGAGGFLLPFAVLTILYFIWQYLCAFILYFIHYLFYQVWGSPALATVVTAAVSLGLLYVFFSAATYFVLWPPVMQMSGYDLGDSWYYQLKMLSGNQHKLKLALCFPAALVAAVILLFNLFVPEAYMVYIRAVCFLFEFMYLPALSMTAYFDITGTERRDLIARKKYYLR
ncbi:hypothetical protein FACS1894211_08620 [Clostridia bacterium]|nr:hypothetical protein FACS1894211_08620 [Clostridia bacterium]